MECVAQTVKAQNSLIRRCSRSPFQIAICTVLEVPGELLQYFPDVIISSSVLHDEVAAHTARVRSIARQPVLQHNDNAAVRRALDQRSRPFRDFAAGDEVAVWRRGTAEVYQAKACSEEVQESSWERCEEITSWPCLEALSRLFQKNTCDTERTRKKRRVEWWSATFKEQPKFCGKRGQQEIFQGVSDQDWPDGEVEPDRDLDQEEMTTEKPSVTVTERPVVRRRLTSKTELLVIESEKGNEVIIGSESRSSQHILTRPRFDNSNLGRTTNAVDEPLSKQPRLGDRTFLCLYLLHHLVFLLFMMTRRKRQIIVCWLHH